MDIDIVTVYAPGHWDPYDSYGLIACQLARHLERPGVWVNAMGMGDTVVEHQPADVRAITARPIWAALGGILLGYPTTYARFSALATRGPRVAVTMFESTRIPAGWPPILNELDAVVVPSTFCRDVFAECGVTAPLHVVPLGIGECYRPAPRRMDRPFTFLAFMDRGRRKGGHYALQAFVRAFGDDPAYRLILKSRAADLKQVALNPNVDIVQEDMTEQELYELYLQADVLVNPNMGEGFGLIPREFAATGGIALATDWGGTADDLDLWGYPIPYRLIPAWDDHERHKGLGLWAEPDVDALARLMRQVAEHREAYRRQAWALAPAVHELYSWAAFADSVLNIWQEVAHGHRATAQAVLG